MRVPLLLLLLLSLSGPQTSFGQARTFTARTRISPVPVAPKAVVVLLPYSVKRVQVLKEQGNSYDLAIMMNDLEQVRKRILNDFRDNYKYGTYYLLPDSVEVLSKESNWRSKLLDKTGAPATDLIIGENDTNFMFAFYSYREREKVRTNTVGAGKGTSYEAGGLEAVYKAWVLTDYQLNPYPDKLDRRRRYTLPGFKGPNPRRVYYYESSLFDINYRAAALKLWENLYEFLGPPPQG